MGWSIVLAIALVIACADIITLRRRIAALEAARLDHAKLLAATADNVHGLTRLMTNVIGRQIKG